MDQKALTKKSNILPAIFIGNLIEFYDYALYGFLIPKISDQFFLSEDIILSYIMAFAVFAIGFIARPLGAIIYGHIGDRKGRGVALSNSFIIMAIATLAMALVPTYNQVGILSPLLLIIARILQSIVLGGEFSGSMVFLSEYYGKSCNRTFINSVNCSFGMAGWFLGLAMTYMFTLPDLPSYAWRIPFLLGFGLIILGIYLRRDLVNNTDTMLENTAKKLHPPIVYLLKHNQRELLQGFGIGIVIGVTFYGHFIFLNTYMQAILGLPSTVTSILTEFGMLSYLIFLPLFGYLSDKIGQIRVLKTSLFLLIVINFPLHYLTSTKITGLIFLSQGLAGAALAAFMAPSSLVLALLFPYNVRYTGAALSYNIGMSIFGGMTPVLSMAFVSLSGNLIAPAFWFLLCYIIAWMILRNLKQI